MTLVLFSFSCLIRNMFHLQLHLLLHQQQHLRRLAFRFRYFCFYRDLQNRLLLRRNLIIMVPFRFQNKINFKMCDKVFLKMVGMLAQCSLYTTVTTIIYYRNKQFDKEVIKQGSKQESK